MTARIFRDLVQSESSDWTNFCYLSWDCAGKPPRLEPSRIFSSPIDYCFDAYTWLENRYVTQFRAVFNRLRPDSKLVLSLGPNFSGFWKIYFDPWSLWKQLSPLFAFSTALNGIRNTHIDLAVAYIMGQGVPSKAVDDILDTANHSNDRFHLQNVLLFCMIAYATGIGLLREADTTEHMEQAFLVYTKTMYDCMWKELKERHKAPQYVSEELLASYINNESRLLSSVFYSITIEWAYLLAEMELTSESREAWISLRRVRQLNDEIIDVDEDFCNGIPTYPILHSLTSKAHGDKMRHILERAWGLVERQEKVPPDLLHQFRDAIRSTNSLLAASRQSFGLLSRTTSYVVNHFRAEQAFEISLMLNQRLATILLHAYSDWGHLDVEYHPQVYSLLGDNVG